MAEQDNTPRLRSVKKLIRVTFPDGTCFCYQSTTMTFMETLRQIGIEKLQKVNLEVSHLPVITNECYPQYKEYMKPIVDGWWVNLFGSDYKRKV